MDNKKNKGIKKFIKIFNISISAILLIAMICVASLTIQKLILKKEVPNVFGYKILQVMSGSMSGEFETGDTIIIKNINNEKDLKIGDVVTFKVKKNTLVTHRIVDITKVDDKLMYTTKGDANNIEDIEKISISDIEGVYVKKIITIGKIINFMQEPYGMIITFTVPIILIIVIINKEKIKEEKRNIRREKRLKHEIIKTKEKLVDDNHEKI